MFNFKNKADNEETLLRARELELASAERTSATVTLNAAEVPFLLAQTLQTTCGWSFAVKRNASAHQTRLDFSLNSPEGRRKSCARPVEKSC